MLNNLPFIRCTFELFGQKFYQSYKTSLGSLRAPFMWTLFVPCTFVPSYFTIKLRTHHSCMHVCHSPSNCERDHNRPPYLTSTLLNITYVRMYVGFNRAIYHRPYSLQRKRCFIYMHVPYSCFNCERDYYPLYCTR
jgi:hypothetical protein